MGQSSPVHKHYRLRGTGGPSCSPPPIAGSLRRVTSTSQENHKASNSGLDLPCPSPSSLALVFLLNPSRLLSLDGDHLQPLPRPFLALFYHPTSSSTAHKVTKALPAARPSCSYPANHVPVLQQMSIPRPRNRSDIAPPNNFPRTRCWKRSVA